MKHLMPSIAIASAVFISGGTTAFAASDSSETTKRVETQVPDRAHVTQAGFSKTTAMQAIPATFDSESPNVGEVTEDLEYDGVSFGWIDENGNPLELTRSGNEILVKREDGPTSRLQITDFSGVIEPQIGTSAVVMAE